MAAPDPVYPRRARKGDGVFGQTQDPVGRGVFGAATTGTGVLGSAANGIGVAGNTSTGHGVLGTNSGTGGFGVYARLQNTSNADAALFAESKGKGSAVRADNTSTATKPAVAATSSACIDAHRAPGRGRRGRCRWQRAGVERRRRRVVHP